MADPSSPTPITVAPLPLLPHPSSLSNGSGFSITEARRTLEELSSLRQEIINQSSNPPVYGLPPLPGIPIPPSHPRKVSIIGTTGKTSSPSLTPSIPPSSPLHGLSTLEECCGKMRELGYVVEERYNGTAIWIVVDNLASWILLREPVKGEQTSVRSLRFYDDNINDKPIHAHSSSAPLRTLAKHLSELSLSLPELFFRLISLPNVLKQPCQYCQKRLKVPDGLPYAKTGYLSSPREDSDRPEEGRWVNWHPSCDPS